LKKFGKEIDKIEGRSLSFVAKKNKGKHHKSDKVQKISFCYCVFSTTTKKKGK
jgi:hypothetical protein